MGPLLPALLAVLLAAAPAFAQSFDFRTAETSLDQDLDPHYAIEFLKNTDAQHANQLLDADREAHLVERATALKDMSDLLISYVDPSAMNEALRLRLGDDDANPDGAKLLGFGAHPEKLLAWRAKYFNYVPADGVQKALWEWDTLASEQRDWLSASPRSFTKDTWDASSFTARLTALHAWAGVIYDALMKRSPKTPAEMAAMGVERQSIWSVMDGTQKRLSGEYMMKASVAVAGLQQLPRSVLESRDPAIRDLLAKARAGASPLDTLAALSALFDKAGIPNPAVQAQAPDRPDQKLSSLDPKFFGDMLGTALLTEVGDVEAGRVLVEFFKTHPLKIATRDLETNLAQFQFGDGLFVFNERFLTDWIKSQGLSAQAVISDPARFHELVMILAPNFVHESTHQMQKAFADDHGILMWNAQHQEIEAKEVQSDYMLEKMTKDVSYREFLLRARANSHVVQQDLAQTGAFVRSPRAFRAVVMSDYYAGLPSLEIVESNSLLFLDSNIDALRAEKTRRAALPAAQREQIERTGFDADEDFKTMGEWKAYLMKVKTRVIDQLIAKDSEERVKTLKTYELTRAREDQAYDRIESDVESVIRGDAPPKQEVPPPEGLR
ncbi:MAG: hypothetical protein ACHQ2Z_09795 [Elusimicrobiota bacterium]